MLFKVGGTSMPSEDELDQIHDKTVSHVMKDTNNPYLYIANINTFNRGTNQAKESDDENIDISTENEDNSRPNPSANQKKKKKKKSNSLIIIIIIIILLLLIVLGIGSFIYYRKYFSKNKLIKQGSDSSFESQFSGSSVHSKQILNKSQTGTRTLFKMEDEL